MVCRDCLKYKQHKDKCWFYWEGKRACSRFEDATGERYRDTSIDTELMMHDLLEEIQNNKR
ncbi:MAG: hypothetical protein R6U32_01760 [Candidatus Woesearchaeota archaeon]